jgi:hypothetical protein
MRHGEHAARRARREVGRDGEKQMTGDSKATRRGGDTETRRKTVENVQIVETVEIVKIVETTQFVVRLLRLLRLLRFLSLPCEL